MSLQLLKRMNLVPLPEIKPQDVTETVEALEHFFNQITDAGGLILDIFSPQSGDCAQPVLMALVRLVDTPLSG